jgi:hypothetical protein
MSCFFCVNTQSVQAAAAAVAKAQTEWEAANIATIARAKAAATVSSTVAAITSTASNLVLTVYACYSVILDVRVATKSRSSGMFEVVKIGNDNCCNAFNLLLLLLLLLAARTDQWSCCYCASKSCDVG